MGSDDLNGGKGQGGLSLPLKLAIGSALAVGAVVTGFAATPQGRRLVRDTFRGTRRSRIEEAALQALEDDRELRKLRLSALDYGDGRLALSGDVPTDALRERALDAVTGLRGVREVVDNLTVEPVVSTRL